MHRVGMAASLLMMKDWTALKNLNFDLWILKLLFIAPFLIFIMQFINIFDGYFFSQFSGLDVRLASVLGITQQKIDEDVIQLFFGSNSLYFWSPVEDGVLLRSQEVSSFEFYRLYGIVGHLLLIGYLYAVRREITVCYKSKLINVMILLVYSSNPTFISFGAMLAYSGLQKIFSRSKGKISKFQESN
jgi:hypothetical protein